MGASSSGLLDETKISHIKGLVDSSLQSFSVFYKQQYAVAYFAHLQQEVEPKKAGRGLLLTGRPHYSPEEVLYQSSVQVSCWDELGKKCRERYAILRREYNMEIHDNLETFSRGCAAKTVIQPAGASIFTTEEESRAHLEKICAGVLTGANKDSSPRVSPPDVFVVYLHLPYRGHTCFLFEKEEERDRLLSALNTCIRHRNIDPWSDSSYESQAFSRALRLYRQDKGCYESWEILLGTESQVLASQVMEEVLPWLLSQLQSRVKGKKTERMRLWIATVQATYMLVLEQLSTSLEALRDECRQTASVNQTLIRSDLDQITSSHRFLEQKIRDYMCEEAEKECSECISPYMSSILEVLTEHVSTGVVRMRDALQSEMNSAFSNSKGGAEEALSGLNAIDLDECFKQVDRFSEKVDLKQRFGLNSTEKLLHSAHLEIQKLLDSAVYTLEKYLQSSAKQASQISAKMERAKERVLKQLDYDSRVVQTRLYEEALLEITLPCLTRRMDKRKSELQQFEQFIFSDYTSFILVQNIYEDALRNILTADIMKAVHDAASKKSNNLLLDASDLTLSQYSLLDPTPPRSAPDSPDIQVRDFSSKGISQSHWVADNDGGQAAELSELKTATDVKPDQSAPGNPKQDAVLTSPVIVVTQQFEETESTQASCAKQMREDVQLSSDEPSKATEVEENTNCEAAVAHDANPPNKTAALEAATRDPPEATFLVSPQFEDVQAGLTLTAPPQNLVSPGQSAAPPSPVVVAVGQCDGSAGTETPGLNRMEDEDQEGADDLSAPAAAPETSNPHSAVINDDCKVADMTVEITGSSGSSLLESPEAPKAQDDCDQSAKTENCVSLDHTTSDNSVISLGSLSEAICSGSSDISVTQTVATQRTDRAVYLTGEMKNNLVMERYIKVNKEKEREAAEMFTKEMDEAEKEEETREERDVAQIESEAVDEGYKSSGSPAESTGALTTLREAGDRLSDGETGAEMDEELKKDVEEEAAETGNQEEEGAEKVEVLQSPQSQSERDSELLPDSVTVIRELVMEIIEIEETITPPS